MDAAAALIALGTYPDDFFSQVFRAARGEFSVEKTRFGDCDESV